MRALLVVAGTALGILVAGSAGAEDPPAVPPDTPKDPAEEKPADPPPEATPPPPAPAPVEPPPKESAPPKVTLEETPEEPPAAPPRRKKPASTEVTLEETPEEPPAAAKTKSRAPRRRPKADEPAPPPESAPASTGGGKRTAESAPAEAPEDEEPGAKSKDDDDDGDGLFGPFRIGALVGTGLPSIVSFGGIIKLTRFLGAGLNIGLIPAIQLSLYGKAELSYQQYDLYGRLFPFGGSLFAGAGVGYATMNGSFKSSYDVSAYQTMPPLLPNPLSVSSKGSVRTLVLTPTIGLLHTFGSGFTLGFDVGAQIPIAPSTTKYKTTVPASVPAEVIAKYVTPNDKKVQDTLDTVGRTILPTLNLRLGWLL